jgi:hypothetical protein
MSEIDTQHDDAAPMTFAAFKERTAQDLRKVAALLEDCAKEAEEGDMDAVEHTLFDSLGLWQQMLVLRFAHCREQLSNKDKP